MANDQDKRFAAATGVGLTVATTILQISVSAEALGRQCQEIRALL